MIQPKIFPEQKPYQPFGGAEDLFYCKDREILIEGPAGTGKSRGVLEKVHLCACKYPGIRVLLTRKTRKSMTESVLVTYEEKVLPTGSSIKAGPAREQRHSYKYPNGSIIVLGGMDNVDDFMSTEFDIICAFEAHQLSEDDWEKITTRLRNGVMPYQQAIADTNPAAPTHWLNRRANAKRMRRILSRHEDNPSVTPEYLNTLDALTGARYLRLRKGIWAAQEGLVYEEYNPAIHLLDRFVIPPEWQRFRVIDFGYTNPFVCQWWARDSDDRIYRYREIYYTKRLVSDHAAGILKQKGERYAATIADHDAEDRATLQAASIHTIPALKEVSPGIQAVQARLKVRGDGKPGLFLLRDSLIERDESLTEAKKPTCTDEEFDNYAWPKGADGKTMKEAPVKVDDHGMDAMRYMCMYLTKPQASAPRSRVV